MSGITKVFPLWEWIQHIILTSLRRCYNIKHNCKRTNGWFDEIVMRYYIWLRIFIQTIENVLSREEEEKVVSKILWSIKCKKKKVKRNQIKSCDILHEKKKNEKFEFPIDTKVNNRVPILTSYQDYSFINNVIDREISPDYCVQINERYHLTFHHNVNDILVK